MMPHGPTKSDGRSSCADEARSPAAARIEEAPAADASLALLDEVVAKLVPYMTEAIIPTGQVVNPLLDVWEAAHAIDPIASSPIEHLLTSLLTRAWVTRAELLSVLDEVRASALQATLLSDALTTP